MFSFVDGGWISAHLQLNTQESKFLAHFEVVVAGHCQISPFWSVRKGVDVNKHFSNELGKLGLLCSWRTF